jgi:hypothetical protein
MAVEWAKDGVKPDKDFADRVEALKDRLLTAEDVAMRGIGEWEIRPKKEPIIMSAPDFLLSYRTWITLTPTTSG